MTFGKIGLLLLLLVLLVLLVLLHGKLRLVLELLLVLHLLVVVVMVVDLLVLEQLFQRVGRRIHVRGETHGTHGSRSTHVGSERGSFQVGRR